MQNGGLISVAVLNITAPEVGLESSLPAKFDWLHDVVGQLTVNAIICTEINHQEKRTCEPDTSTCKAALSFDCSKTSFNFRRVPADAATDGFTV